MIGSGKRNGESCFGKMGFPIFSVCLLLLVLGFSGCASRSEILSFKENSNYTRARLDTLNLNVENLRMTMETVQIRQDQLVEEMASDSDLRQQKAYFGSRLDDIESQLQTLSAQLNDLSQRLTGVVQRVDEMKYGSKSSAAADTTDTTRTATIELRELYDQAYRDLTKGNYDLAKSGFEEYLRQFPDTELADNALYWLGEAEYVQHNYPDALVKFQQVLTSYPQGNKVPSALFKIGLCQLALKQKKEAKAAFGELVDKYPSAPEASQAKARLKELK
ncbi:MAG: tol-pal system protein YbgF [bacterium]|nr:tol-pal system protein YbgF [bacterium]